MKEKLVAMILAGGKGTRLEALTKKAAKPAVSYGAKYRIIDFPLSNCANTGIRTVGILTQYESTALDLYIANGEKWGLNGIRSLTTTLSPRQTEKGLNWYKGTADAIYQNLDFLDRVDPEYVLILSGDHIYSTTYTEMLNQHIENNADCTIAVYQVPMSEASRFGILVTDKNNNIVKFVEKPKNPTSDLASMGVYIFTYKVLRKALIKDAQKEQSSHDFGKDIIPTMLAEEKKLMAYQYKGYWKDVGTIASLHEANMDLLGENGKNLNDILAGNIIYSEDTNSHPQFVGKDAIIKDALINQGATIYGTVKHSVLSNEVVINEGAEVINSVLMPGVKVGKDAKVYNAMVGPNSVIEDGQVVGDLNEKVILFANGKEN